ncbi:hypothetical protein V8G54_014623, partial [Vigna mungo]
FGLALPSHDKYRRFNSFLLIKFACLASHSFGTFSRPMILSLPPRFKLCNSAKPHPGFEPTTKMLSVLRCLNLPIFGGISCVGSMPSITICLRSCIIYSTLYFQHPPLLCFFHFQ